jgi:hypothetical protein
MDPVWTGQVERNGTREVDTVDLAAIKAHSESTFPQQPESSPISMPNTRSQTARSYGTNPLPTLEEDLRKLDVDDGGETAPQIRPRTPSLDHDAEAERREAAEAEAIETRTTPRSRKITSSTHSFQMGLVRGADPNDGRCLITNLMSPAVQSCHLVAQATNAQTVRVSGFHISHLYSLNLTCRSRNWSMSGG